MKHALVVDSRGLELAPCPEDKARRLVQTGQADLLSENPLRISLHYAVERPSVAPVERPHPLQGKRVLLHICCGPCATYTVAHLRAVGADVLGYWYNPNIHPFSEHERRREALQHFADQAALAMLWEPQYEMLDFLRVVVGHERAGERCSICYALRLDRAARAAARHGLDAFTTTLLISPYQDQEAIRRSAEAAAEVHGVPFYFENLRRGFAEHHRLAEQYGLYRQRYCGCLYSEWESLTKPKLDATDTPGDLGRG